VLLIDSTQDLRSRAAFIRPVVLVTITVSAPSAATYRLSHDFRVYGANEYLDALIEVSPIVTAIGHLGNVMRPETISLRLRNDELGGEPLLDLFLSSAIEGAQVRVEELLLSTEESRFKPTSAGPVTRFLGRIRRVTDITARQFTVECVDELIALDDAIDWYTVKEADGAPKEAVGLRLPKVYGSGALVKAVPWDRGAFTTLGQDLTQTATGAIKVGSTKDIVVAAGSGDVVVGGEVMHITAKDDAASTITVTLRGQSGTAAVPHKIGESVLEISHDSTWIAADGGDNKAVSRVFVRRPGTEQLIDVTSKASVNLTHSGLVSGRTVASVKITKANLQSLKLIDDLIQQPVPSASLTEMAFDEAWAVTTDGSTSLRLVGSSLLSEPLLEGAAGGTFNELHRFIGLAKDDTAIVQKIRVGFLADYKRIFTAQNVITDVTITGPLGVILATTGVSSNTNGAKVAQSALVDIAASGFTINDFVNSAFSTVGARVFVKVTTNNVTAFHTDQTQVAFGKITVEFQLEPLSTRAASFSPAFDLEMWIQMDGAKVPSADATYTVAAGTLIEKDVDIARHILKKQLKAGAPSQTLASDWNAQAALDGTNIKHAFDLRDVGPSLSDALGRLADESRLNVLLDAGTWRAIRRRTLPPGYTAADIEIQEGQTVGGLTIQPRGLEEIVNAVKARYQRNPTLAGDEGFEGLREASDTASQALFGVREHEVLSYLTILDQATATDALAEYLQEIGDRRLEFQTDLPYYEAYLFQVGDVIRVLSPYKSQTVSARIVRLERDLDSQVTRLSLVQVPGLLSASRQTRFDVAGVLSQSRQTKFDVAGVLSQSRQTKFDVLRQPPNLLDDGRNLDDGSILD